MEKGDILRQEAYESYVQPVIRHYDAVLLKVEAMQDSKLHYLPQHQCPNPKCGDIGQHIWDNKDKDIPAKWIFYCPYCHVHYYIHYYETRKEELIHGNSK